MIKSSSTDTALIIKGVEMKLLYRLMIVAGLILIIGAAGSDEAYGMAYPLHELIVTAGAGLALLIGGMMLRERKGE